MNFSIVACIGMGVFTTYVGLMMLTTHFSTPTEVKEPVLEKNFTVREASIVDENSGLRTTYRDITVSTHLGDPWTALKKRGKGAKTPEPEAPEEPVLLQP
jgi:hypothetical protein